MNTSKYKILNPKAKVMMLRPGKPGRVVVLDDAMSDADAEQLCKRRNKNIMRMPEGMAADADEKKTTASAVKKGK